MSTRHYSIHAGWRVWFADAGLDTANVLRRADLPADLLSRERTSLTTEAFFRLWEAIEAEAADPLAALHLGSSISVEAFDPAIFAALCSPDLNTALQRIARYKPLICPMRLEVDVGRTATRLQLHWLEADRPPPASLAIFEHAFFTRLARIGTREHIEPVEVGVPALPSPPEAYTSWFGVPVTRTDTLSIAFRAEDARRPFLTASPAMWNVFEAELRRRLADLETDASAAERVKAALLDLLPGGGASMAAVAKRLGTSTRTLQRRLKQEAQTYQGVLDATREQLARHYLRNTMLTGAEISFLLGFSDPNCFFRAWHGWTGTTPNQARVALQAAG